MLTYHFLLEGAMGAAEARQESASAIAEHLWTWALRELGGCPAATGTYFRTRRWNGTSEAHIVSCHLKDCSLVCERGLLSCLSKSCLALPLS